MDKVTEKHSIEFHNSFTTSRNAAHAMPCTSREECSCSTSATVPSERVRAHILQASAALSSKYTTAHLLQASAALSSEYAGHHQDPHQCRSTCVGPCAERSTYVGPQQEDFIIIYDEDDMPRPEQFSHLSNRADMTTTPSKQPSEFKPLEVHEEMTNIFHDVWKRHGNGCSEAIYQRAVARRAYIQGLPVTMERALFADYGEGYLLAGRIDMEVASSCLYEMKIGPVKLKDSGQVEKYLRAYDKSGSDDIKIASLVYFTSNGVVVHDVRNDCAGRAKDRRARSA